MDLNPAHICHRTLPTQLALLPRPGPWSRESGPGGISALSKRSPPSPTRQALPLAAHPLQHTLPRAFPKGLQTPPLPSPLCLLCSLCPVHCKVRGPPSSSGAVQPPQSSTFLATNNKPASTQRVSHSCPTLTLPARDTSSTKQASKRYPTGQPQIFLRFFTANQLLGHSSPVKITNINDIQVTRRGGFPAGSVSAISAWES